MTWKCGDFAISPPHELPTRKCGDRLRISAQNEPPVKHTTTPRAETSLPVTIFPSWLTGAAFAGLPETTHRAETSLPVTILPAHLCELPTRKCGDRLRISAQNEPPVKHTTTPRAETSLPVTIFPSWLSGAAFAGLPETTHCAETSKPVTTFPVNSPDPCKL